VKHFEKNKTKKNQQQQKTKTKNWWLIWYTASCVVDSDNRTYIVIALSSCR
jgi:hypothetical protein